MTILEIEQLPISSSVVIQDQNNLKLSQNFNNDNIQKSQLLSDIPCYKCDATGLRKNTVCPKCMGFKFIKNSKKIQAIDFIIEKRLQEIFKELLQNGEEIDFD